MAAGWSGAGLSAPPSELREAGRRRGLWMRLHRAVQSAADRAPARHRGGFRRHTTPTLAEFPTGDWYGTIEYSEDSVILGVRTTIKDHMDIVLEYDGKGNLQGSLTGNRSFSVQNHPNCNWATTIPSKLRGRLLGSYTPGAGVMSIQLVEPVVAPTTKKVCPGGGYIISGHSIHEWPPFKNALSSPRRGRGRHVPVEL